MQNKNKGNNSKHTFNFAPISLQETCTPSLVSTVLTMTK